jgi:superfamily II DNA or RNA helicase
MPIAPEAIKAFLALKFAPLPDFKAMNEAQCLKMIKALTGRDFKAKTWPRLYQLQGIAASLHQRQFLLYYDMQLGKTLCALAWAEHLKHSGIWSGTGIIIAHAPVALDVWESQAKQHSALNLRVARTNFDDFVKAIEDEVDFIVMTWSGLQAIFTEKRPNRKKVMTLYPNKELLALAADCLSCFVIDEIHKAKDPYGLWFELADLISSQCSLRLGLTGTPLNRNAFDMWAQIKLIDRGQRLGWNFNFFKEAFGAKFKNYARGGMIDVKFDESKMPILSQRVASCSLSYTRVEAGVFVDVQESVVKLHMHGEQLAAYEACITEVIEMVDGGLNADHEITNSFSKLRQISSGWDPFHDSKGARRNAKFKHSAKLDWLEEFFAELAGKPQIIIFCEHIYCNEIISDLLTKKKISHGRVYGHTTPSQDKQTIADFQSGKLQVFLANSRSGGTSITLNAADYMIFFESPMSSIDKKQAAARANADRGSRTLWTIDLCCSPTERKILQFIEEGKDLEHALKTAKDRKSLFKGLSIHA